MSALVFAIGWTLLHFLWQGLLLGCATAMILTLLRNARPELRYAVACAALLACLGWPAAELWLRLRGGAAAGGGSLLASGLPTMSLAGGTGLRSVQQAMRWLVGLWALGAAALALRMAFGLLWIERSASRPAPQYRAEQAQWQARLTQLALRFGLTRPVRLRIVDTLASPITAGWWRPVVLVPAALIAGLPPDLLEALLAHELAHIRRCDYLVNLMQNVIEALLFYHPAVWWISRRIRTERELIADDFAARQLGEPRRLALALSELERLQFSTHHLALAANGGDLMVRIQRLIRPAPQALNWKAAIPMLGLALACVSIYAQAVAADGGASNTETARADFSVCSKPAWPKAALEARNTGTVTLSFLVDSSGKIKDSKVAKSSGHPVLDEAARDGIGKCTFKPATEAGRPIESWMKMQYVWTLD